MFSTESLRSAGGGVADASTEGGIAGGVSDAGVSDVGGGLEGVVGGDMAAGFCAGGGPGHVSHDFPVSRCTGRCAAASELPGVRDAAGAGVGEAGVPQPI